VLPRARWSCLFATPLLGWHRRLITGAWTYPHRQTGRPPLDQETQQLIVRLAKPNPRWGYQHIKGELQHLGVRVSATAIRATLRRHGLNPTPRRADGTRRVFLGQQASGDGRLRFSSPWIRCGSGGCMCCASSNWTPAGSTSPA
jgi:putative transposase